MPDNKNILLLEYDNNNNDSNNYNPAIRTYKDEYILKTKFIRGLQLKTIIYFLS